MLWFTVAIVVAVLAFVVSYFANRNWGGDVIESLVTGFVSLLFAGVLALFLNLGFMGHPAKATAVNETYNLKNLQQTTHNTGRFFLGSGSFGGEPVYYYYVSTGENRFTLEHVKAESAEIVEDSSTPRLEVSYTHVEKDGNFWSFIPFTEDKNYRYVFYVPKGSISDSFALGPQK